MTLLALRLATVQLRQPAGDIRCWAGIHGGSIHVCGQTCFHNHRHCHAHKPTMATPTSATVMGAADRFRLLVESLPDEERQLFESCNNADKLFENVKDLESKNHHNKGKDRRRYMELTKTFIEAVQPMFKNLGHV